MGPYGGQQQFAFPATSPGPPIQMTASNKGPDGANLFIFHIPNHFTNLDMYQLFCPYGNLLSVRIMVEKDTGRSRGFGFVSYDSPESAALAIKELNGFAVSIFYLFHSDNMALTFKLILTLFLLVSFLQIGNKRLKVQHKQIRPNDQQNDRIPSNNHQSGYEDQMGGGRGQMLPPPGPMMSGSSEVWYDQPGGGPMPDTIGANGEVQDDNVGPEGNSNAVGVSDPLSDLEPLRQALPDVGNEN
jgi:RNA recognition motif-containing protein